MKYVNQFWAAEQAFEVTGLINDSGAVVAMRNLLWLTRNEIIPFYIASSYLISLAFKCFLERSASTLEISLELANTQNFSRCKTGILHMWQAVKESDEEIAMTLIPDIPMGLSGLVREQAVPASAAAHQSAHSPPSRLASRCSPILTARHFSPECSKLSSSHPAWHQYASDFMWTRKQWQLVVKLWGHRKQWVNSSWISVPSSTERDSLEAARGTSPWDGDTAQARLEERHVFQFTLLGLF